MSDAGMDLARLEEIRQGLGELGYKYAKATQHFIGMDEKKELAEAKALLKATGSSKELREAEALIALDEQGIYREWMDSKALLKAMEARYRVWATEISALQTKLNVEKSLMGGGY